MDVLQRIEAATRGALSDESLKGTPPKLAKAIQYAVFPGGARIRPLILMSVAMASGDDDPALSDAAACALEMIHCASLVHDDLPCFDNADLRRGKDTVHRAFSEPLSVLAGDSLIIHAFAHLARTPARHPARVTELIEVLSRYSGVPHGICAGQGWESEENIDLHAYHRSKTAALFIASTQMGAVAAGQNAEEWFELGARIGEAFQVADDLRDVLCSSDEIGKPNGQDQRNDRPNIVAQMGAKGAAEHLNNILAGAISSIPRCPGEAKLAEMVRYQADKIMPAKHIIQRI